jgi:hypothetical protein
VVKIENQISKNLAQKIRVENFGLLCVVGLDSSLNKKQIFCEKLGCKLKKVLF